MSTPDILPGILRALGFTPAAYDGLMARAETWYQKAYPKGHPEGAPAVKEWKLRAIWDEGVLEFTFAQAPETPRKGDMILYGSELVRVLGWGQDFATLSALDGHAYRHSVLGWRNHILVTLIPAAHEHTIAALRRGYAAGVFSRDCHCTNLRFGDVLELHHLARQIIKENL